MNESFSEIAARVRRENTTTTAPERLAAAIETLAHEITRNSTPAHIRKTGKKHHTARLEQLHGAIQAYGVLTGQHDTLKSYLSVTLPVHVAATVDEADDKASQA